MTLHFFNKQETQEMLKKLNEQFGINEIPGILLKIGLERIFLFQGSLDEKQIKEIEKNIPVERLGVYFAKVQNDEIRLSIEGVNILKDQINKNIFELNKEQLEEWMKGSELNISTGKKGFLIMKYKDDLVGTGKASELKISNFIPKSRRLKEKG